MLGRTNAVASKVTIDGEKYRGNIALVSEYHDIELEAMPLPLEDGAAVTLNNEIHTLGNTNSSDDGNIKGHYKYDGLGWSEVSTAPYALPHCAAVVLNGEIHILGGSSLKTYSSTYHYKWDGEAWTQVSTLPYSFGYGAAAVLNDEIHILGGNYSAAPTNHYKWDGEAWTQASTLPHSFNQCSAAVLDGEIHIVGGNSSANAYHCKWNGEAWTDISTPPDYRHKSIIYNDRLYIYYSNAMYMLEGAEWINRPALPVQAFRLIVRSDDIYSLGSTSTADYKKLFLINCKRYKQVRG